MVNKEFPTRKSPAHLSVIEFTNRSNIVFVTVCSQDRKNIFANKESFFLMQQAWDAANSWKVGRYIILPDHIHLFCAPSSAIVEPLTQWIKYWKSYVSFRWPKPEDQPIWQKGYWDRQLRNAASYAAKWLYVQNNPMRHGLVGNSKNWQYKGEMNIFRWHNA